MVVTQGSQSRTYVYDALGRLISETNPESGTTNYTYDTDTTCGTYNGDRVKRVDALNNVTCYQQDALHRNTAVTYPSGPYASTTASKSFVYDSTTFSCPNGSNVKGRLAEAFTGPSSAKITDLAFCYSTRGETTDFYESTPHSGGYYHVTASYWANGMLNTLRGVGLPTLTYGPDGEGRPTTVSASSGVNPVSSTSYNSSGQATDVTFGSLDPAHFGFDSVTGRMTQYKLTINGTATYGNMQWNANGTLKQLAITDPFNGSDAQTCNYGYDDLAWLASTDCGASIWQQNFTYDQFGNITKSVPLSGTGLAFNPGYDPTSNHYTDAATYDGNGNLTNDGTDHQYSWDTDGHPVTLDSLHLIYDALGREVELQNGSANTEFAYGPTGKLALMNGQTQTKAFVPLPGGTQVKYAGGSISTYRLPDWLGSFRVGSNPNRTYSWGLAFAPFGEQYAIKGSAALSFTGEEGTADTVSDEYDFLARKLHSAQGRWLSPDPAGLGAVDPSTPQTWNRYAYVANNPLSFIDPYGLFVGACGSRENRRCNSDPEGDNTGFWMWNPLSLLAGLGTRCTFGDCQVQTIEGADDFLFDYTLGSPDSGNGPANNASDRLTKLLNQLKTCPQGAAMANSLIQMQASGKLVLTNLGGADGSTSFTGTISIDSTYGISAHNLGHEYFHTIQMNTFISAGQAGADANGFPSAGPVMGAVAWTGARDYNALASVFNGTSGFGPLDAEAEAFGQQISSQCRID
jgi:RHS repeat-associated protein